MGVTSQGFGQEGYVLEDEQQIDRPQPEQLNFATGVPYFLPFATPYRDSWEIFRDDPVTVKQLVTMRRRDGQARALYRLLTKPILASLKHSDVIPIDGEEGGTEEAEHCKNLLFLPPSAGGMTHSFTRFVTQMLLALFTGFSAWEFVYWVPKSGPNKGKVCIRKMDWRPSETLTFLTDGQGEFNGMRQRTFFQGRTIDVKIEKDVALYYAHDEAERPFYGVSMFESAFYHYDKKIKLYYIAHLAAQRSAVGLRVGTMPPNPPAADKNNFVRGLADLGLAQYMVCPSADWTVTNIKEEGNFDFLGLINHHNSQMSKSVLAPWFDEQQGGGQGDTSLVDFGKQSDASFMMMLEMVLEEMGSVITDHILPRFVDWNFGTAKYPRWKWGTLTAEQKAAIQDTFDKLASAGQTANVSSEFMTAIEKKMATDLGLAIDYAPIEARNIEKQKLKDEADKAQLKMMASPAMMQPAGAGATAGASSGSSSGGGPSGGTKLPSSVATNPPNPFGTGGNTSSPKGAGPGGAYGMSSTAAALLSDLLELSRLEAELNGRSGSGGGPASGAREDPAGGLGPAAGSGPEGESGS